MTVRPFITEDSLRNLSVICPIPEGNRDLFEDIPQWEDDGGRVVEIDHSTPEQFPVHHIYSISGSAYIRKRKKRMSKKVGLWLDRKKAVIVSSVNNIEARRIITSDMEHGHYVLYSTVVPGDGSPEDIRDRRFWDHLGEYYDKIIAYIRDATEIQIFGPEHAKYELKKRLESEGLALQIVSVEDAGKLTDLQIATRVEKRFPARSQFDIF